MLQTPRICKLDYANPQQMISIVDDFLGLFYPELCITCGRRLLAQERYLCLYCVQDLPRTHYHKSPDNKVASLFWGRVPVEQATSWLFFRKGSRYQKLVHYLKYKGLKEIGEFMGRYMGKDLKDSDFSQVDVVAAVPLHARKERQRGYNQSAWIASGVAAALSKPVSSGNLVRVVFTPTQTRRNRFERWQNVEGIFRVIRREEFQDKHVLVVDDVITTGSTLEAAVAVLLKAGAAKVSIATLACAEI